MVVAILATTGCGGGDEGVPPARTAAITVPPEAVEACERLAATETVGVLCPAHGAGSIVHLIHEDLDPDPCTYVVNLETHEPDPDDRSPSHVLFGGTCARLPLRELPDGRWDIDPPLSLRLAGSPPLVLGQPPRVARPHVVARLRVRGGHRALLLRSDPFPEGGTNGSHYSLAWNEGGAGYQVSAHYATADRGRDPRPDQRAALVRFAESLHRPA